MLFNFILGRKKQKTAQAILEGEAKD